MSQVAAYGDWTSPITIASVLAGQRGLNGVALDGADVLWLETPVGQDGRQTVMRLRDGDTAELTPAPLSVRSRVNEYGGGAWSARRGHLVACDDTAARLVHRTPDGRLTPLTPESTQLRYGDLHVHPDRGLVLAVREDHRAGGEAVTSIVVLRLGSDNSDGGRVILQGADFYADPQLRDDGALAWAEWSHPDMPWDASRLMAGRLIDDLVVGAYPLTLGTSSAQHPRWTPAGDLTAMDDSSGFWNLVAGPPPVLRSVHPMDADCDTPAWTLGNSPFAIADARTAVIAWWQDARAHLGRLDLMNGDLTPIDLDISSVDSLAANADAAYAIVGHPDRGAELIRIPRAGGEGAPGVSVLRRAMDAAPDPATLSRPQSISVRGRLGHVQAWFYPPANTAFEPRPQDLPPAIVLSHGGPTSFATADYNPRIQFWTSRGYGVVDVNYSGSAGFGRAYRERLKGRWGIADVQDCEDVVRALVARGAIDPSRVAISGGSAGGYTTLQALVSSDEFAAGISSYGIGDLEALQRDTHKFESRYTEGLVAPWPAGRDVYRERSPIHHVDRLHTPMLILQGRDDRVVPPEQALAMAAAVRSRGLPVELIMFDGEGHGFRGEAAKAASLEAQLRFLTTLFLPAGNP